jgi:hypothetical protein
MSGDRTSTHAPAIGVGFAPSFLAQETIDDCSQQHPLIRFLVLNLRVCSKRPTAPKRLVVRGVRDRLRWRGNCCRHERDTCVIVPAFVLATLNNHCSSAGSRRALLHFPNTMLFRNR